MGCTGDAAAASLMIDQTSCRWPATRRAGLNFSSIFVCDENVLRPLTDAKLGVVVRHDREATGRITERRTVMVLLVANVIWIKNEE